MNDRPRRRHSVSLPLFLIAGGAYLLAWNLDLTAWSPWDVAFTLWPLLLVGLGLDLVLGRLRGWVAFPLAALVLALLGAAAVTLSHGPRAEEPPVTGEPVPVAVPLDGAATARVELRVAGGGLELGAGPGTGPDLVSGSAGAPGGRGLRVSSSLRGDELRVVLRSPRRGFVVPGVLGGPSGPGRWDLRLRPGVPLSLDARAAAARVRVDLGGLDVRSLRFALEAGEGSLVLPEPPGEPGEVVATIGVTLGRLRITLPEGVPVRIVPSTSLARIRVDRDRLRLRGGAWESEGFAEAARRLTLRVHATLGRVLVR